MSTETIAIAQVLETIDAQARAAKRAEAASRRQARELRRTAESLRCACLELGIEFVTQPEEGQSAGRHSRP